MTRKMLLIVMVKTAMKRPVGVVNLGARGLEKEVGFNLPNKNALKRRDCTRLVYLGFQFPLPAHTLQANSAQKPVKSSSEKTW